MAVRIRKDLKTIVCAAKSRARKTDVYIDDGLHYMLSVEMKVMSCKGKDSRGAHLWEFHAPLPDYRENCTRKQLLLAGIK